MSSKILSLGLILFSPLGFAQSRDSLFSKSRPSANLIQESHSISLQGEASIQQPLPPSQYSITLLGGTWSPSHLRIISRGKAVDYPFAQSIPVLSVLFESYPFRYHGQWGLTLGGSYGFTEQDAKPATALHLLIGQVSLAYRLELSSSQPLIPYGKIGYNAVSLIQRGTEVYNTNENGSFSSLTAGLSFQLNRMHVIESRNQTALTLQYERSQGPHSQIQDWNGNKIELGATLTL